MPSDGELGWAPKIREASIEDHIVADCPTCMEPMLLGKNWRELILEDEVADVMECPDCEDGTGDSWAEGVDPMLDAIEFHAIAGDVIREVDA